MAIKYPQAIYDEEEKRWISGAEVAEIPFTAFTSRRKAEHISARLIANVEWDTLALAGRAVHPGALRIASPASASGIQTVAYLNPDGSHVLTAYNSTTTNRTLTLNAGTHTLGAPAPAGAVVTVTW